MAPIKLATSRFAPGGPSAERARTGPPAGASWLRFGDELAWLAEPEHWSGVAQAARGAGVALREHPREIDRTRLYLVNQKGRLFQREHPEAKVLLDKGRFLLVDLDPGAAAAMAKDVRPCFSLRAVAELDDTGAGGHVIFSARADAARTADPVIQAMVNRLSRATYEADLRWLAGLPTRLSSSAHYRTACDLMDQKLAALGYTTSRQAIVADGASSQNVIARRAGSGPAATRGVVIVTAHLDSINIENGPAADAPGADDDGSGSAGVLEMARALKDYPGVHDLVLVLFGGEEQGLFGSQQFVGAMSAAERQRVRCAVTMDMIGVLNTTVPTVLLEGRAQSQSLIDGLASAAATYTGLAVETSLHAANSDHVSFLDKSVPAVLTIEGADSTNEDLHSARDTLDRINFDLALEILRMNTAYAAQARRSACSAAA
jgi:hypothetical protein